MIGKLINKFKEFNSNIKQRPRSGEVHSVAALFDKPDDIINAASTVAEAGYRKFDVYTPYPLHGMDDAMKMKETKIGWVALLAGMAGTATAFAMIYFMVGFDYKNIFGGKPYFNIPPSIPIAFELTVLFAALASVGAMIAVFNKLPWMANPLHDTDFMKRTTSDMFGIAIEAKDEKFNQSEVTSLFNGLGAKHVYTINYPIEDLGDTKAPILNKKFVMTLVLVSIITAAGTYGTLNKLLLLPPFNWMQNQFKILPQATDKFFADTRTNRNPVDGTVPRGFIPYEFKGMPDSLVKPAPNPLEFTEKVIEKGKDRYNTYCSPCHGYYGKGDSRLKGQFPNPPTLHSEKVTKWSDANIYHVITNGQNVMPSYERQISRDDRWAIIHYLRVLQRSQNAKDSDLETTK